MQISLDLSARGSQLTNSMEQGHSARMFITVFTTAR